MRRYIVVSMLFALIMFAAIGLGRKREYENVRIYYADAQAMKLIGIETQVEKDTTENMAQEVVNAIIEGHDENNKIRRVVPKVKNGMDVRVNNGVAYVDIKREMIDKQEKNRDIEALCVYSVVNSLTGIEGIDAVNFTIDGITQKDYAGFFDMRRTFTYNGIY